MNMEKPIHRATLALITVFAVCAAQPLVAQSEIIKLEAIASYYGDEFQGRPTSSGELFDMNALTAAHKTLPFGTMLEVTNLANGKKVVVRVNDRGPFVETRELDVSKAAAAQLGMLESGTARVSIRKIAGLDAAAVGAAHTPVTAANDEPVTVIAGTQAIAAPATVASTSAPANAPVTMPVSAPATLSAPATQPVVPAAANPVAQPVQTVESPLLGEKTTGLNWRIQLGSFSNEENANRLVIRLRKDGFNPAFEKSGALTRVVIASIPDRELAATRSRLDTAGYGQYLVRQESW